MGVSTKRRGWVRGLGLLIVPVGLASMGCGSEGPANPVTTTPDTLSAPEKGQGFQIKTGSFPVPAGTEEQDCYFFKVGDVASANGLPADQPVNLHRVQIVQKAGSHHMNIFRVRTIRGLDPANGAVQRGVNGTGECFKSPNWSDWPLVANTQQEGDVDWTYPDGVANILDPNEWLMLQTHYVNATTQTVPDSQGAVAANFYALPKEQVKAELGTLFATNQSIRICQDNPTPTYTASCHIKSAGPATIIGANGHFHSRGTQFQMYTWDGMTAGTPPDSQRFYTSLAWNEPPMLHSPQLSVAVPNAGGVVYSCSYQWQAPDPAVGCDGLNSYDATKNPGQKPDCCYAFGAQVDKNEHCNAFVYYYPKDETAGINCN